MILFVTAQTLVVLDLDDQIEATWSLACRDWRIVRRCGKPFRDDGRSVR